jgi:hypothetical protein
LNYLLPDDPEFTQIAKDIAGSELNLNKQFKKNSGKWKDEKITDTHQLEKARLFISDLKHLF